MKVSASNIRLATGAGYFRPFDHITTPEMCKFTRAQIRNVYRVIAVDLGNQFPQVLCFKTGRRGAKHKNIFCQIKWFTFLLLAQTQASFSPSAHPKLSPVQVVNWHHHHHYHHLIIVYHLSSSNDLHIIAGWTPRSHLVSLSIPHFRSHSLVFTFSKDLNLGHLQPRRFAWMRFLGYWATFASKIKMLPTGNKIFYRLSILESGLLLNHVSGVGVWERSKDPRTVTIGGWTPQHGTPPRLTTAF